MKGKYTSFNEPIWSLTIVPKVWKEDSKAIDHLDGINLESLFPYMCKPKIINKLSSVYKPKLVILKFKNPKIGALKLIKLLTSNWLRGDKINELTNINFLCFYSLSYFYFYICFFLFDTSALEEGYDTWSKFNNILFLIVILLIFYESLLDLEIIIVANIANNNIILKVISKIAP